MLENYEHNLKLYNESMRKDLDITLTSIIPTQKNLMKTILWINFSIVGLSITAMSHKIGVIYIAMPFMFSFCAIITILFSLKDGRIKTLGTPSIKSIEKLINTKYEKIDGFITMNESFEKALNQSVELISKRAEKIAFSTNVTILSICSVFLISIIYVNIYFMKGG